MIVKIKTFSGETLYLQEKDYLQELMYSDEEQQEETLSPKKKLSKEDKIALGAAVGGLGIAGLGQGYASKKKRDFFKQAIDHYTHPSDTNREKAKNAANLEWFIKSDNSLKKLREDAKFWQENAFGPVADYKYNQAKNLLGRKKGKIARNIGLGIAGATALGYGGYKLYKHHKNKKKQQEENDN